MPYRSLSVVLATSALAGAAWAAPAHEHGAARLDIAVEPSRITLFLEMPLDNLTGFERAPKSDAERASVDAALARLREAGQMFRIDPAAGCAEGEVTLRAEALGPGAPPAVATREGHADLDLQAAFSCPNGARAGFIEIGLFEAFPRLKRLDLQIVTPRGQMKATLRRPQTRVTLVR